MINNQFWKTYWSLSTVNGFRSDISSFNFMEILHQKGFDYGIPHKHDTYVEVAVRFLREFLEMNHLPAHPKFVICRTKICKNSPSLLMPDLEFSFDNSWLSQVNPSSQGIPLGISQLLQRKYRVCRGFWCMFWITSLVHFKKKKKTNFLVTKLVFE